VIQTRLLPDHSEVLYSILKSALRLIWLDDDMSVTVFSLRPRVERTWDSGSTSCATVSQRHCRSEARFPPANLEAGRASYRNSGQLPFVIRPCVLRRRPLRLYQLDLHCCHRAALSRPSSYDDLLINCIFRRFCLLSQLVLHDHDCNKP
jgi:hypothetical protein